MISGENTAFSALRAPFTLLLKPAGARCNLACKYCFYSSKSEGVMSREVFERAIDGYLSLPFLRKSVVLQGGEPLFAPSWMFDALSLAPVERSIQTNATLITPSIAARLAAAGFLVGVSVDGPEPLHDLHRGEGSFRAAERGIRHLESAGADYNILAVVTPHSAPRAKQIYRFLRDNFATRRHQYIECTGPATEFAISGADWGTFLCDLFDEWRADELSGISIRLFESLFSALERGLALQCSLSPSCRHHLVIDWDGSVYPCDFFVDAEHKLGNILVDSFENILTSASYKSFAEAKTVALDAKCRDCRHLALCFGDCPRSKRTLCDGYKRFFNHALLSPSQLLPGRGRS